MRLLSLMLTLLLCLVAVLLAMLLVLNNDQSVSLSLGVLQTPGLPFGLWLLIAFVLGALANQIYSSLRSVSLRFRLRRSDRKLQLARQEADQLRTEKQPV